MSKKRTSAAAAETINTAQNEVEAVMYIGPSFKGVTSRTIFRNGLTPQLEEAVGKTPAIKLLIVPISKLAKAQLELADKSSARATAYAVALKAYT